MVNFYIQLVIRKLAKNTLFFSSFFLVKLEQSKKEKTFDSFVKSWCKREKVFKHDTVLIPINIANSHWTLVHIQPKKRKITYLDSFRGKNVSCVELVKEFLIERRKEERENEIMWQVEYRQDIPKQTNSYDCGVFVCLNAMAICLGQDPKYKQQDIENFRKQIFLQILQNRLG